MVSPFADIDSFLAVADVASFRRAAETMGVTPAAVSKAIGRLERRLGTALFLRTTRRVSLTPEGEAFRVRCRAALSEIEAGAGEIDSSRMAMSGELVVTAPFVVGRLLSARLPEFLSAFPALSVRLELTDRRVDLPGERVDIGIRIGDPGEPGLVVRRLAGLRWIMVASPEYLRTQGMPTHPADLSGHRGLAFLAPSGHVAPWRFVENARHYENTPSPGLIVDEGEFLVDAAIAGGGVAQVFSFMAAAPLADGRLASLLDRFQPDGPEINAVFAVGRNANPRVRALLDFLYGVFAAF